MLLTSDERIWGWSSRGDSWTESSRREYRTLEDVRDDEVMKAVSLWIFGHESRLLKSFSSANESSGNMWAWNFYLAPCSSPPLTLVVKMELLCSRSYVFTVLMMRISSFACFTKRRGCKSFFMHPQLIMIVFELVSLSRRIQTVNA